MPMNTVDFATLKHILVIKLRHHGDVLLTSPLFSALARACPQAEVDALVYADTASLLENNPQINQLHTIDRNWKKQGARAQLQAEWQLLQTLRQRQYDLIIHLTNHPRGAWLSRILRPRWAVAPANPRRPGLWQRAFTHRYRVLGGNRRHTVDLHLDALRCLGLIVQRDTLPLVLHPSANAHAEIARLLRFHGLQGKDFLHFHPASRWLFKCWPIDRAVAWLRLAHAQGHRLVLTGAPQGEEAHYVTQIITAVPEIPLVNLCGQLTLPMLGALSAQARVFVGMDSAPMHIAAAMQTPTVALFGPSGDIEWAPWQTPMQVLTATQFHCRPCGQDGCAGSKRSDCLDAITPEQVMAAVNDLLAQFA